MRIKNSCALDLLWEGPLSVVPLYIQGRFLLYILVEDDDEAEGVGGVDIVDNIFIAAELSATTASSDSVVEVTAAGDYGNAMLLLSYWVQCTPGFTGLDCTGNCGTVITNEHLGS